MPLFPLLLKCIGPGELSATPKLSEGFVPLPLLSTEHYRVMSLPRDYSGRLHVCEAMGPVRLNRLGPPWSVRVNYSEPQLGGI